MLETELKSVVPDLDVALQRLNEAGADLRFEGRLEDRRYDTPAGALAHDDHVLRVRVYRASAGGPPSRAELGFKGPTTRQLGYKVREEISAGVVDPELLAEILERLGYRITMAIDREIWEYSVSGATVRFERYPRMDDLVEVEGEQEAIEQAIAVLALPREGFTSERLPDFVRKFEARTGGAASLSVAELQGATHYDVDNA